MSNLVDLSWNEFESCTRDTFKNLLLDTNFTDVTLVCEDDKQLKAHKVILSACSSFFNKIFVTNHHENLVIYLKGMKYKELEAIIRFIYLGQTRINEEDLEPFMIAAKDLQIKDLLWHSKNIRHIDTDTSETQSANFLTNSSLTFIRQEEFNDDNSEDQYEDLVEQFNKYKEEGRSKSPNQCDQCEYRTNKAGNLQRHKKSVHSVPTYKCENCEKTFKTVAMCREHNKLVHTGVNNTETPIRPIVITQYPCNLCPYTASSAKIIQLHKDTVHTFL